jgi:hypothetical protein
MSKPSSYPVYNRGYNMCIFHQAFEDGPDRGFRNVGKT